MKRIKRLPALLLTAVVMALCALIIIFSAGTGKAYAAGDYRFTIKQYDVDYTINADRTMQVVEYTTIKFEGYDSTGHVHLIPVNAGDRVRDLKVYEVIGGKDSSVDYTVTDEYSGFIAADIGDYSNKTGQTHTYKLTYTYAITKPTNDNAIYLNAIGFGWDCEIEKANITLRLPEGFKADGSHYFKGKTTVKSPVAAYTQGNVISLSVENLARENGVTFDLYFNEGVLSTKTETTPYLLLIIGGVLFIVMIVVKLLCFNKGGLAPVTNVEAPDKMDPLEMGKLVDNKVDKSDVTSLIFYWANNGNLKIDLSDEKDVTLIRISQHLPENAPEHQKIMFESLFAKGEMVNVKSLTNSFYTTVESVTKKVNSEHGNLYTGSSMAAAFIFVLFGGLFMGVTPLIYGMLTISMKFINFISLFALIPAFAVFILMQPVIYERYKKKKTASLISVIGVTALSVLFTLLYVLLVPSYIIEIVPKILICVATYAIIILSVPLISRTDDYTEQLNKILGFKDFIESVEKDRLETMIEENPELYYKVLPYAQVLGVSDVWEDKFKSININPPSWAVGYGGFDVFDLIVFNHVMRSMNRNMVTTMTSRPQPSSGGLSGGGFGGGFGGFGGGGHGGGGGFGR